MKRPTESIVATALGVIVALGPVTAALAANGVSHGGSGGTPSVALPGTPAPNITTVHFSNIGPNMRIEVDGSGFGTPAVGMPHTGTVPNFQFQDVVRGGTWGDWNGNGPRYGSLQYTSWRSTRIVASLFPQNDCGATCVVRAGDSATVFVENFQSGKSATWRGILGGGPAATPADDVLNLSFTHVAPGGKQIATAVAQPGSSGVLVVGYPGGKQQVVGPKTAGRGGRAVFVWDVPNGITGGADVRMWSGGGGGIQFSAAAEGAFTVTSGPGPAPSPSPSPVSVPASSSVPAPSPCPSPAITGGALDLCFTSVAPGGRQVAIVGQVTPGSSAVLLVNYPGGELQVFGPTVAAVGGYVAYAWDVPKDKTGAVGVMMTSEVNEGGEAGSPWATEFSVPEVFVIGGTSTTTSTTT